MQANVTPEQVKAGIQVVLAVANAIQELKQVPSGHLYARMMAHLDQPAYDKVINILKNTGLVTEQNHMHTVG